MYKSYNPCNVNEITYFFTYFEAVSMFSTYSLYPSNDQERAKPTGWNFCVVLASLEMWKKS